MSRVRIARISADPLDVGAHLSAVEDDTVGAVATFVGTVRAHDAASRHPVVALDYSAHPDAEATLRRLAAVAVGTVPALVAVSHRVGRLAVGDAAVVIAVGTAHRGDAFAICRDLIETIKRELPVWKRQLTADGSAQWLGVGG